MGKAIREVKSYHINKKALEKLQDRIKAYDRWDPVIGDLIYVRGAMYIDHGEDDVVGGLAEITGVSKKSNDRLTSIQVAQHPGRSYYWGPLLDEQKALQKEYGLKVAYPDPDLG